MIKHALETQKPILDMLKEAYKKDHLSHAYMFVGEDGTEKLGVALYFACMLYCDDVCLKCKNCENIINFKHMNVLYVSPQDTIIKVDQIEKLKAELSKTSLEEGPRVYIIDGADKMNSATANKLLKFIEEPFEGTYAILLTDNKDAILPTINSRCQLINLLPADKKEITKKLIEKGMDEENAALLPHLYSSIVQSEKALENPIFQTSLKIVKSIGLMMSNKLANSTMIFRNYLDVYADKENVEMLLKIMFLYFLEMKKKSTSIFIKEKEIFDKINIDVEKIIDIIVKSQFKLRYNIDRVLMLNCILLKIDRMVLDESN